jgi:hypothetical protein
MVGKSMPHYDIKLFVVRPAIDIDIGQWQRCLGNGTNENANSQNLNSQIASVFQNPQPNNTFSLAKAARSCWRRGVTTVQVASGQENRALAPSN